MADSIQDYVWSRLNLVQVFVTGKAQDHFIGLAERINEFIGKSAPILEAVYVATMAFDKRPFFSVRSKDVVVVYRTDLQSTEQALEVYDQLIVASDYHLEMATSRHGLADFLTMNGIPPVAIPYFEEQLRASWDKTYGLMARKFTRMREILFELRDLLHKQIDALRSLGQDNYLTAFDSSHDLVRYFLLERDIFYNKLVREWLQDGGELDGLRALYSSHKLRIKESLRAYIGLHGTNFKAKWGASRGVLQKSLLTSIYALGALHLALNLNIRKTVLKKGIGFLMDKAITLSNTRSVGTNPDALQTEDRKLQLEGDLMAQGAKNLAASSTDAAVDVGVRSLIELMGNA